MTHPHAIAHGAVRRESVLARIIRHQEDGLSADAARWLLRLDFDEKDRDRMHDLAARNNAGDLSTEELAEYRQVGLLLDLLKSKARLSLKRRKKAFPLSEHCSK